MAKASSPGKRVLLALALWLTLAGMSACAAPAGTPAPQASAGKPQFVVFYSPI